jgi:hypothetical protein
MFLLKQARAGRPTAWSQTIAKAAGSLLIKAGEALKAIAQRETVLNS